MVRVFLRTHCPEVSDSCVRVTCNLQHKKIAMDDKEKDGEGEKHHGSLRAAHQRLDTLVTPMAPLCYRSGSTISHPHFSHLAATCLFPVSLCVFFNCVFLLCVEPSASAMEAAPNEQAASAVHGYRRFL